jgi:ABC-type phosphate transport system permease subunit
MPYGLGFCIPTMIARARRGPAAVPDAVRTSADQRGTASLESTVLVVIPAVARASLVPDELPGRWAAAWVS